MKFEFETDIIDVDLPTDMIAGLQQLVSGEVVSPDRVREFLLQVRFFEDNLDLLVEDFAGKTIVIEGRQVVFDGRTDEALAWVDERDPVQDGIVYVASVPRIRPGGQFANLGIGASTGTPSASA